MSGSTAVGEMGNVNSPDATGPSPAGSGRAARRFRLGIPRLGTLNVGFAFGFIGLMILLAVTADWIPGLAKPDVGWGEFHATPTLDLNGLLGADTLGHSIVSRIIYGARISLVIAILPTLIAMTIGLALGMLAGYYRGSVERIVDLYANTIASMPPLLLLLAIIAATGPSLWTMALAMSFLQSGQYARATKGAVISHAGREYVLAARALGASDARILIQELLPNLVPTLTAVVPPSMAILIVVEGSLSFLGYGIPPPAPSWGGMIASTSDVLQLFPYLLIGPILAIVLTVYSLNTIGDYMSSRINVREGQL
jgi:peptide/nickel transport system permease protein